MFLAHSPLRVSFFGGGTDYPSWFNKYGGKVIGTSVDRYCTWAFNIKSDYLVDINCKDIELVNSLSHYLNLEIPEIDSLSTNIHSYLNKGAGASSATINSLIGLLLNLSQKEYTPLEISKLTTKYEQNILGKNVGCQDQLLSAIGGFNRIDFENDGGIKIENLNFGIVEQLKEDLYLIDTCVRRNARDVIHDYTQSCNTVSPHLHDLMSIVDEVTSVIKKDLDIEIFAKYLDESWKIKKEMSSKMTNADIDDLYSVLKRNGCLGAKLLGAGGGGYFAAIIPKTAMAKIQIALPKLNIEKVSPESNGLYIQGEESLSNIGLV